MSWSETLYEEVDNIQFCIYSEGKYVEMSGFEETELIIEIKKEPGLSFNFEQLEIFLKNIDSYDRVTKFENFLKQNEIPYKTHIWQRPLL